MLRVISGKYKGRRLSSVGAENVRPTLGRGRQVMFDMLSHAIGSENRSFSGMCVVDCFAGTGALGIEAVSRGAQKSIFIEKSKNNCALIKGNAAFLEEEIDIINSDMFGVPKDKITSGSVDLVFIDPPYAKGLASLCAQFILDNGWLSDQAFLVLEMGAKEDFELPDGIIEKKVRIVSNSKFVIARCAAGK